MKIIVLVLLALSVCRPSFAGDLTEFSVQRRQNTSHAQNSGTSGGSESASGSSGGQSGSAGAPSNPLSHVPPQGDASAGHAPTNPGSGHH